jgi:ABC-type glycerol-3-phosphate transport system substrate-binding protein
MALASVSCVKNDGEPSDTGGPVKQKLENVYKASELALEVETGNAGLLDAANGRAYFNRYTFIDNSGGPSVPVPIAPLTDDIQYRTDDEPADDDTMLEEVEEAEAAGYTELYEIISIALDGSETEPQTHLSIQAGRKSSDGENVYRYSNISMMKCLTDGKFAVALNESYEDYSDDMNPVYEQKTTFRLYDESWNEMISVDLKELLTGGDENNNEYDYLYVNGAAQDGDGTIYLNFGSFILAVDETGRRLFELKALDNTNFDSLARFSDGRAAVCVSDYSSGGAARTWQVIDKVTRGWGESISFALPGNMWVNGEYMTGEGEYLLCFAAAQKGIYGMLPGGESREIVNFLNSDIDGSNTNGIKSIGGGEFLMLAYEPGGARLMKLTPVPDAENKEKIILSVATLYDDYTFRRQVLDFNRKNDEYKFTIEDYSTYNTDGNWDVGISKLRADLITGKIPDILVLDEQLDLPTLASKGLFADMYELIDASDKVNREDFVQSVLKADEIGGKLYRLMPYFYIQTATAKRSVVGDTIGWTLDDMERTLADMPEGTRSFYMMSRDDALSTGLMLGMSQFIDRTTGTCSFDESFIHLLEFANGFPETATWDGWEQEDWDRYQNAQRDNYAILSMESVGSYRAIRDFEERLGEEVTFVGFPTDSGSGSVIFPNGGQYAISARGEFKQICFDFLYGLVDTEPMFSDGGHYWGGSFSISQNYMDKVKEYELTPMKDRPGYVPNDGKPAPAPRYTSSSVVAVPEVDMANNEYDENYHLTQAEIDAVDALIASTTQIFTYYTEVLTIISEEAAEYFAGRKSAEETARLVQSRVQIYISESR